MCQSCLLQDSQEVGMWKVMGTKSWPLCWITSSFSLTKRLVIQSTTGSHQQSPLLANYLHAQTGHLPAFYSRLHRHRESEMTPNQYRTDHRIASLFTNSPEIFLAHPSLQRKGHQTESHDGHEITSCNNQVGVIIVCKTLTNE